MITKHYTITHTFPSWSWGSLGKVAGFRLVHSSDSWAEELPSAPFNLVRISSISLTFIKTMASSTTAELYAYYNQSYFGTDAQVITDDHVASVTFDGTSDATITLINNGIALDNHPYLVLVLSANATNCTVTLDITCECSSPVICLETSNVTISSGVGFGGATLSSGFPKYYSKINFVDTYFYFSESASSATATVNYIDDHGSIVFTTYNEDLNYSTKSLQVNQVAYDNSYLKGKSSINVSWTINNAPSFTNAYMNARIIYTRPDFKVGYYLENDDEFDSCVAHYYDGTSYKKCEPYYYNGTEWVLCDYKKEE